MWTKILDLNRTHARQETPWAEKNAEPTVVRPEAAHQGHNFCSLTNSFYHSKFPKMRWRPDAAGAARHGGTKIITSHNLESTTEL